MGPALPVLSAVLEIAYVDFIVEIAEFYNYRQDSYNYWKCVDRTHYSSSIPNGAYGCYTIMQLMNTHVTG